MSPAHPSSRVKIRPIAPPPPSNVKITCYPSLITPRRRICKNQDPRPRNYGTSKVIHAETDIDWKVLNLERRVIRVTSFQRHQRCKDRGLSRPRTTSTGTTTCNFVVPPRHVLALAAEIENCRVSICNRRACAHYHSFQNPIHHESWDSQQRQKIRSCSHHAVNYQIAKWMRDVGSIYHPHSVEDGSRKSTRTKPIQCIHHQQC